MVDKDGMPLIAMITEEATMIEEVNTMGENPKGCFVDTGATRHGCGDKALFSTFKEASGEEKLYMRNKATASIKGEGTVILKMTSGKELTLTNVLYVPEIRKNLVSGWMLNKFGFRLVFESDNFVLSRRGMFVGKGYAHNGMFKMNSPGPGHCDPLVKWIRVLGQTHATSSTTADEAGPSSSTWLDEAGLSSSTRLDETHERPEVEEDDMLIIGSDDNMINSTKDVLKARFDMKTWVSRM
ncbi:uncharacterized protein LOC110932823 [Helianthus annuus]|uniref:uncharacterized protein LOC110932823 n=1 Tax=Helianthus annuus TaxID=4232 RepID=UPI000B8F3652|nr:uncharacterized protein LOC110932823 [Helianthus annuus]